MNNLDCIKSDRQNVAVGSGFVKLPCNRIHLDSDIELSIIFMCFFIELHTLNASKLYVSGNSRGSN